VELSGAFGDMGTFLPLLVAMVEVNGLPLVASLFFAGVFNIGSGLLYGIPMAVQPMKAIAAAAVSQGLSADEIVAAGVISGVAVLVLALSGGLRWIEVLVPESVVRGLQLGIGLSLGHKAIGWMLESRDAPVAVLLVLSLGLVLASLRWSIPAALIVFMAGLILELFLQPELLAGAALGLTLPSLAPPRPEAFIGGMRLAMAQVPLTTLNSVIGVVLLTKDLFPSAISREGHPGIVRVSQRSVATTVGTMNVLGALFGAMPMCHGAGGLAGQYRFGARSGRSVLALGAGKIVVAVTLGAPLITMIHAYPQPLLGLLLLAASVELAQMSRRVRGDRPYQIALLTAAGTLGGGIMVGVLLGTVSHWVLVAFGKLTVGSAARQGGEES
jgi:hypothetical protein